MRPQFSYLLASARASSHPRREPANREESSNSARSPPPSTSHPSCFLLSIVRRQLRARHPLRSRPTLQKVREIFARNNRTQRYCATKPLTSPKLIVITSVNFFSALSHLICARFAFALIRFLLFYFSLPPSPLRCMQVLMEGTPTFLDYTDIMEVFMQIDGVIRVHNLRLWGLSANKSALSAHLAIGN